MLSALAPALSSLLLLGPLPLVAQEETRDHEFDQGSFVEFDSVTPAQIENLVTLGKVWGFLKYHHPLVTGGEIDWDAELFRALPQVLDASDRAGGNRALLEWVARIGDAEPCESCAQPSAGAYLQPDIAWIADEARLGHELSAYLARVHQNRPSAKEQRYVSFAPGI